MHIASFQTQVAKDDFVLPLDKAKVMRAGSDVTIVSFSRMVGVCLQVLSKCAVGHLHHKDPRIPMLSRITDFLLICVTSIISMVTMHLCCGARILRLRVHDSHGGGISRQPTRTWRLQAADKLAQEGIQAEVINLRSIRPLDVKTIADSVRERAFFYASVHIVCVFCMS
jgi:hypothetical protein